MQNVVFFENNKDIKAFYGDNIYANIHIYTNKECCIFFLVVRRLLPELHVCRAVVPFLSLPESLTCIKIVHMWGMYVCRYAAIKI